MVATDRAAAGGAAGAGGHGYGARVAAYYAVSILREAAAAPGFELPQSVTLESLRCETPQAVDDLELATSEGGRVLLQIKRRVQASTTERSDLASSTDQFVREFLSVGAPAGGRPFDRRRNRLVLMCGPASSATIVRALPVVLARLRDTPPTRAEEVRRTNAEERRAWGALLTVLRAAWVRHTGEEPPDEKLVELLTAVWVVALEVEAGGRDEQAALERLREGVLVDPGMAALTWRALAERMLGLAGVRSGITRTGLHEFLVATGVRLQVVRSMRGDVARLRERSLATRDRLARYSRLRLGSGNATIERTALVDLAAVVLHSPLLLIGAPGTGKSGLIHALLERFDADGVDCVALAAEDYAVGDLSELRSKLELEHDLTEVLDGWPGDPGVVVIDGLDAARGADGPAAFVELVETLARDGGRWKVLASVRTFDLRHHRELREAVPPAAVPTRFCDAEFVETGHFRVPELSDAELASLASSAPALAAVLGQADHALVNLVRNPFNLNLLAGLAERLRIEELTPIRTQLELLARHWTEWVAEPPQGRHAREGVLEAFCHLATELMRLQVPRSQLLSRSQEAGLLALLLGSGVIVEEFPGGALGTERLSLAHHLLSTSSTHSSCSPRNRRRSMTGSPPTPRPCCWRARVWCCDSKRYGMTPPDGRTSGMRRLCWRMVRQGPWLG